MKKRTSIEKIIKLQRNVEDYSVASYAGAMRAASLCGPKWLSKFKSFMEFPEEYFLEEIMEEIRLSKMSKTRFLNLQTLYRYCNQHLNEQIIKKLNQ